MTSSNSPLNRIRCTVGRIKTTKYNNLFMHTFQFLTNGSVLGLGQGRPREACRYCQEAIFFLEDMSRDKCNSLPLKKTTSHCFYRLIYHRSKLHVSTTSRTLFFFSFFYFLYSLRLICRLVFVRVTYRRAPRPLRGPFARNTTKYECQIIQASLDSISS